jgi:hypothetical protein
VAAASHVTRLAPPPDRVLRVPAAPVSTPSRPAHLAYVRCRHISMANAVGLVHESPLAGGGGRGDRLLGGGIEDGRVQRWAEDEDANLHGVVLRMLSDVYLTNIEPQKRGE